MTTTLTGPSAQARAALRRDATRVLLANWTGMSTVPSRTLYPHQWSWDSAFIAIGLRHLSPRRAQRELEALLGAQWGDGRIPHIVFNPAVRLDAYFPGPDFWQSTTAGRAAGAPPGVETSGIVQPPVHALAAALVHRSDPESSRRRGFLKWIYPRLVAWHAYLLRDRDFTGHGLASIVHPWESGMDNSPCWDGPLQRIVPVPAASFRRADLAHSDPADRPTDLDYGRYVRLATDYRGHGYRDAGTSHPFAVEDPGFNALLIASEHALAGIARVLGRDPRPHRERAEALTDSLVRHLWQPHAGMFLCRDVRADRVIEEMSVTGLLPLVVPSLPGRIASAMLRTARGDHFGLGSTSALVPSYDLLGSAFDASRYWCGPAWFNINWIIERGLRLHGAETEASALRHAVLDAAGASRFAEYIDPLTGRGRGATHFSWTAAVTIDFLDDHGRNHGRDHEHEHDRREYR